MFPKIESGIEYKDLLRSTVDAPDVIIELPVRYEVKKEKYENRLLVLTQYRLYILTSSKPPCKIDTSFNILDVAWIESSSRTSLKLSILPDSKTFTFLTSHPSSSNESSSPVHHSTTFDFDSFLSAFVYAFRLTFPESSRRPLPTITTNPSARVETITAAFGCVSSPNAAATFSAAYRCSCDRLNAEYKPFVAWDVDTIFWMHEDKEMNLADFEQGPVDTLAPKDYLPLFAALQYDTWFTSLNLSQIKLTPELVGELCNVLASNRSITDLRLASVTGRSMNEVLTKIQQTLERCHGGSSISLLDLSGNSFDDKAIAALSVIAGCLASRLSHLCLARCSLSGKQICQLADAPGLRGAAMSGNLTHLDLSSCSCKSDEASVAICNLISYANSLRYLNLSATDINMQNLGNALAVGSSGTLNLLDLSQNSWALRQHVVAGSQLTKFFQIASNLKRLSLAENKLSTDFLRQAMMSFATNAALTDLELDLSGNELQKTSGAVGVIVDTLPLCSCISSLNFSDNGLDTDFSKLIEGASRCIGIHRLNFSKNIPSAKTRLPVAETLASVLQVADSRLKFLDISDCKLRQATSTLCAALTDSRLAEIDVSGNQMMDTGVVYLAKALQGNTRLRRVSLDRNQITLTGYQALVSALGKNYTLTSMPTPLADISLTVTGKTSLVEKCNQIFGKIENLLSRNRETSAFGGGHIVAKQVFRFQTGCGISENLEALWQSYGEVEHLYLSIQPPGGMAPSAAEEPVLAEASSTLSIVREILKKLSNMTYPMPNVSTSEKLFADAVDGVAKQSFQPVVENLAHAVEMLSSKGQHSLLPMSASGVRQILDQTINSCSAEYHKESCRTLVSACYVCHYASLFRVLETITAAVRDRLRDCRLSLTERAAKGRAKPTLSSSLSSPGTAGAYFPASKYGTLNRRQRPVSAMTPDVMPAFSDETPEEAQLSHLYAQVNKTPVSKRMMVNDVFETPPLPAPLQMSTSSIAETSATPGPLLANPCKERPKKPKNQRPTRPVVANSNSTDGDDSSPPPPAIVEPQPFVEVNQVRNKTGPLSPSHATNGNHNNHSVVTPSAVAIASHSARERSESNSGDEVASATKDSSQPSLLAKTSLNKAVIGGVKVGPTINLSDFKLKKRGLPESGSSNNGDSSAPLETPPHHGPQHQQQSQQTTPLNEVATPASLLSSLKRGTSADEAPSPANGGHGNGAEPSGVSMLRPKPPAKPAKPPKPAVPLPAQVASNGNNNKTPNSSSESTAAPSVNSDGSNNRPPSPPSFADPEAFADRMSRFGGAAKARRDQVARSMYVGDQPAPATSQLRPFAVGSIRGNNGNGTSEQQQQPTTAADSSSSSTTHFV